MKRLSRRASGLSPDDFALLKGLRTPSRIQDYLNSLPMNWEKRGETLRSPAGALSARQAHCIEGALIAATALWIQGEAPLLMDLKVDPRSRDYDHVVALYRRGPYWGAISQTNHAVLRYRDPIYRTTRELALSYFHEWFLNESGKKTLVSYSEPFDLTSLGTSWITAGGDLWEIGRALDKLPHTKIVPRGFARVLRPADPIEREAGSIVAWKRSDPRT